jgi:hypothetical protein
MIPKEELGAPLTCASGCFCLRQGVLRGDPIRGGGDGGPARVPQYLGVGGEGKEGGGGEEEEGRGRGGGGGGGKRRGGGGVVVV